MEGHNNEEKYLWNENMDVVIFPGANKSNRIYKKLRFSCFSIYSSNYVAFYKVAFLNRHKASVPLLVIRKLDNCSLSC